MTDAPSDDGLTGREPVAIIGIGCRLPGGGDDPAALWNMLGRRVDAIRDVPSDRWNWRRFYHGDSAQPGRAYLRQAGFLDQPIDQFDAEFFGMSPREAARLDPQQRLLLEVAWEALEDAGQAAERLAGSSTGVFIGGFMMDHALSQAGVLNRDQIGNHTASGSSLTMLSARLAYVLDLRGPTVSVDTACSSSLVATHYACVGLWSGECSLALAGGVNVILSPDVNIALCKANMLARDGRSKAFDARADGYGRGEGAGVVVLKRLSEALADGDQVYAVIRASAVNQDGHTATGISVPNQQAQEAVLRLAYRRARLPPSAVQYVEAHGTGTAVGDPVEAHALGAVLGAGRTVRRPLLLGSLKTNIGHLEAASGVAGLIKAALCLRHRRIPAHLHLKEPSGAIPFAELRLRVPRRGQRWPSTRGVRVAGVSSFGYGGTNAHIVLAEAPPAPDPGAVVGMAPELALIPLSAGSPSGLRALAAAHVHHLSPGGRGSETALVDLGYSLARRRTHLPHRLALVVRDRTELRSALQAFLDGTPCAGSSAARAGRDSRPKLAYVFTGMGPQWPGMGRELLAREPVFRAAVDRCDEFLRPYLKAPLWETLDSGSRARGGEGSALANFALQVGLAELWSSWGITPDAVIGHSVGEIAAAHVAGALELEAAARLCWHRTRLLARAAGHGGMMAAGLDPHAAEDLVARTGDAVTVAAVNSPGSVTLSGDLHALEALAGTLRSRGAFSRMLSVDVPYHSPRLDPLEEEFLATVNGLPAREPPVRMYSTVTGGALTGAPDPAYWWRNVRERVRFASAVARAAAEGVEVFLEIGPHPVLAGSIAECFDRLGRRPVTLASLSRDKPERWSMLAALGCLFTRGHPVRWERLHPRGRLVNLPKYPWQRQRHWSESDVSLEDRVGPTGHPLLGRRLRSPQPAWTGEVSVVMHPFLQDHCIEGEVVFPASAYLEIALAADRELQGEGATRFEGVRFHRALVFKGQTAERFHVSVDPRDGSFAIHGSGDSSVPRWTLRASGRRARPDLEPGPDGPGPDALRRRLGPAIPGEEVYAALGKLGYRYGPAFRGIRRLWQRGNEAVSEIVAPAEVASDSARYFAHPAVLDACLHTLIVPASRLSSAGQRSMYLPVGIDRLDFVRRTGHRVWSHVTLGQRAEGLVEADIRIVDDGGGTLLAMRGVRARVWDRTPAEVDLETYRERWEPAGAPAPPSRMRGRRWLVIGDGEALPRRLAGVMRQAGDEAVIGGSADGVSGALAALEHESDWAGLVYLAAHEADAATALDRGMDDCIAVTHLIQALRLRKTPPRLWLVTRGAQPVRDGDPVSPAQALLWGMARTAFHEHPELRTTAVDLDPRERPDEARALCHELRAGGQDEEVALRADGRRVHRFEVAELATDPSTESQASVNGLAGDVRPAALLRPDACYLVAGGLSGFGLATAGWMVEQGARHLALLSRRGAATPGAGEAVESLARGGASVRILQVDVTDARQVLRGLHELGASMPVLKGIVDAVSDYSVRPGERALLARVTPELMRGLMSAKVVGAWNLHLHTQHLPLDFFVMFSSIAALVGSVGAGPYVAANVFLDALAHHRRRQGLPALSVNWGAVGDVGVLTRHPDLAEHNDVLGYRRLPARQLLAALPRLLREHEVQVGLGSIDWSAFGRARPALAQSSRFAPVKRLFAGNAAGTPEGSRPPVGLLLGLEPSQREEAVLSLVRAVLARVLECPPADVEMDAPLAEKGVDSLVCVEIQVGVEQQTDTLVPLMALLKGPTPRELAGMVMARLADRPTDRASAAHPALVAPDTPEPAVAETG